MRTRRSGRTSPLAYDSEVERSARLRRKAVRQFSTNLDFAGLEELFTEMSDDDANGAESPPRGVDSYYRPGNFEDPSPIVYPAAANGGASNFKIQPNLIAILPVFRGREEPYAHLREFFSIADTYQVNNTTKDGVRLRLFPFSLKDQAKVWFTSLEPGSIHSWSQMQSAFLDEFYSISKTAAIRNKIKSFRQIPSEQFHEAFNRLKELPMLTAPEEQEELIVYLAASKEAVSAVLMTKREARQMPIYFVSRALRGPEVNYTAMEKLVLALVHASKRLRRYFQAHPITVITDQPIKNILSNPEVAGRMQKWSIQLGEFGIHYRPRVSVKGQVLADFIVERPEEEGQDDSAKEEEPLPARWTLFTDGSSCVDGCGAGVILTDPEGVEFTYALRFQFETTNNEAEYEALIAGLRIAEKIGVKNLEVNVDSKLVANQVNGTYIAKETDMIKYLEKVKALTSTFRAFSIKQVPRSKNKKADALSKMASTSFAHLSKQVLVEELKEKSVNEREVLTVVEEEGDTWMTPIHEYLTDETLPAERKKARAIKRKSQRFAIINGILYKKSFLGPWLRCVGPSQANYVLREIHEGSCSMHAGTRSVVAKALRTGYYWPTMHKDARALIKACQECQVHKPVQESAGKIESDHISMAILQMGYRHSRAFPGRTRQSQIPNSGYGLLYQVDRSKTSSNYHMKPNNPFRDWCEKLCIQQHFASVKHPQMNGLVERANRSLEKGIKARLGKDNKNWLEEISHVLWAHRTMIKSSNGDTPFSLTYGMEAVIPAFRTAEVDVAENDEALEINLELLEERREQAAIREAKKQEANGKILQHQS
ncbi:reverse transcriptase domain-containing protein [Tanacetum coccineum]